MLRDKLIKIGAKVVSHCPCLIFQMAEVAVPQTLFRDILDRIRQLCFFGNACEAVIMCSTVENQVPEWRAIMRCAKIVGKGDFSS